MTPTNSSPRTGRAVAAAVDAARALGLDVRAPVVLHDVFSVVVHLAPAPVVARVPTVLALGETAASLCARQQRELDVAAWLCARGVPVAPPSQLVPRAPVARDGRSLTFWALADLAEDHAPYTAVDIERVAELHAALRGYSADALPFLSPFHRGVPASLAFLAERPDLLDLADLDRARREWAVLAPVLASADAFARAFPGLTVQPLHGDAPRYNVLLTRGGPLFSDFEDVTVGPVEWDLAGAEPADLDRYDAAARALGLRPVDRRALEVLGVARMLQAVAAFALVPELPLLATGLAPALEAWRGMRFAGGLLEA